MSPTLLETIRKLLCTRLKAHRQRSGLTQEQAAAKAGIPLRTWRRFEKTGAGNVETLYAVCYALERGRAVENLFPVWQAPKPEHQVRISGEVVREAGRINERP